MGWGDPPHEGYVAHRLRDGSLSVRWSAEIAAQETGRVVVCCSCGWRGSELDEAERYDDPATWTGDHAYQEWRQSHMGPLVDPDPDNVLTLGRDLGGARHFLAGRPVHAGTGLELRLRENVWVPVRYEWDWDSDHPPHLYLALGSRGEDLGFWPESPSFPMPEGAELRWPR